MKLSRIKVGVAHQFGLLALAMPLALAVGSASAARSSAPSSDWASTATGVTDMSAATRIGALADNQVMHVAVALKLRNKDELDALVKRIMDPNDAMFGQHLSRDEIVQKHLPLAEQASMVADYLTQRGATHIRISDSHLLVQADLSAANARSAFNTDFARFNLDGHEAFANTVPARVPSYLHDYVLSVAGLQNAHHMVPQHTVTPDLASTLSPTALPKAYGVVNAGAGTSTAMGIITDGNLAQTQTDFATFLSKNGLGSFTLTIKGPGGTDTSGTVEWNLDSQAIYGMSGGVKSLTLYDGASLSDTDLTANFDLAVTDNTAKAVDASLGECESLANSDGSMAADDQIFETAIAQGQTFFIAAGDGGANTGCYTHRGFKVMPSYPASSPYVTAVGGTTLTVTSSGTYSSEAAWSSGGGGVSTYEAKPSWQNGVTAITGSFRGEPDIAMVAAAKIYYKGIYEGVEGTSVSAPVAAGLFARAETAHGNALGFAAPLIYGLPSSDFHDVTTGSNGKYSAGKGWDFCTGFGSPVGDAYVSGL